MTSNYRILWNAYCEAGEYFSRLGGSGRYVGFSEYHIPALVLILALEKIDNLNSQNDAIRKMLPDEIWVKTDNLPILVSKILDELVYEEPGQLREFVEYVNSAFQKKAPKEFVLWTKFLEKLGEMGWHI